MSKENENPTVRDPVEAVVSENTPLYEYKFRDGDIESVTFENMRSVELLLEENVEAILLYKDDVIALAKHYNLTCDDISR